MPLRYLLTVIYSGLLLLIPLGCGGSEPLARSVGETVPLAASPFSPMKMAGDATANPADRPPAEDSTNASPRQIIYRANMTVEADSLEDFGTKLRQTLDNMNGMITDLQQARRSGSTQSAVWTLRLDSARFDELLEWLDANATVIEKRVTSEDVTEEYVDLDARIKNKLGTEQRLQNILENRQGKLEEILSVENEIDRVREQIERMEGRMRYLRDQISLSTITITVYNRTTYTATAEPSFKTRIAETWSNSTLQLKRTTIAICLLFVRVVPWLVALVPLVLLGFTVLKIGVRKYSSA